MDNGIYSHYEEMQTALRQRRKYFRRFVISLSCLVILLIILTASILFYKIPEIWDIEYIEFFKIPIRMMLAKALLLFFVAILPLIAAVPAFAFSFIAYKKASYREKWVFIFLIVLTILEAWMLIDAISYSHDYF